MTGENSPQPPQSWLGQVRIRISRFMPSGRLPSGTLIILGACLIGLSAGYGAVLFTFLIHIVSYWTVESAIHLSEQDVGYRLLFVVIPALGLLLVAWFTRRFAPEAQGHGVPEVITAVARHDGVIRPRVSVVKILASAFCIGTGGSVGREGPIVQIGSAVGSTVGQFFKFNAENIKILVACGAAAGISATFHAPLAGVVFASEIILGSFAVRSLTPIVIASVLADVVQVHTGEHGLAPAFRGLNYHYLGNVNELPFYFVLGLLAGLFAVMFTKLVYFTEDVFQQRIPQWWQRALLAGTILGLIGAVYPSLPPLLSEAEQHELKSPPPPVFGVGYHVVDHTLNLQNQQKPSPPAKTPPTSDNKEHRDKRVRLDRFMMLQHLWWLLPLLFLKPLLTSTTLAGGGSGGIFAPSLFIGATLGACFGLLANLLVPEWSAHPGVYAVVGMGAVVAGTTHGPLSAILIVYEMTGDYRIILPIMIAAGLASVVARWIDRDSIYEKKLSRRGESLTRGHHVAELEHVKVREVMLREYPVIKTNANVTQMIAIARQDTRLGTLPVVDDDGKLCGLIRPEDLMELKDSTVPPELLLADDLTLRSPLSVSPNDNLLEAIADFGSRDVDTLPVEEGKGNERKLVGMLLRSHVMRRYREELLWRSRG